MSNLSKLHQLLNEVWYVRGHIDAANPMKEEALFTTLITMTELLEELIKGENMIPISEEEYLKNIDNIKGAYN